MGYSAERLTAEIERVEKEGRKGLKRILDADPEYNEKALRLSTNPPKEITYSHFKDVMEHRHHDVDELVQLFRGKIDNPRDFFERLMSCQWKNPETGRYEDRRDVVIPYKSVIDFYHQELHYFKEAAKKKQRFCGCGKPVFGREVYCGRACRQKAYRNRVETGDSANVTI